MKRTLVALVSTALGAVLLMLISAGVIEAVIVMASWLDITHALGIDTQTSKNYAFSSGVGPMMIASLGFSGAGVTVMRHLNCEQKGCWRLGHRHPGHGRPVCRKHYHHNVVPIRPVGATGWNRCASSVTPS